VAEGDGQTMTTHADEETVAIPVHEGDIIVGTQEEEQGRVLLHKEVVHEHETVTVLHEQEHDIAVPAMGEELVVDKQTRATKEVRVRKERVTVEADPDALHADDTGPPQPRNSKRRRKRQ
jgi:hypothetical protein